MPARKHRTKLDDNWKDRIQAGVLVDYLKKHVAGECELSQTQVRAAEILLKKVAPDLKGVEHTGTVEHKHDRDEIETALRQKGLDPDSIRGSLH